MGVLADILSQKAQDLELLRKTKLPAPPPRRAFSLRRRHGDALRLIAEIKRRSPSAGELSKKLTIAERAAAYERAGASMVSVLVDARFFAGAWEHLAEARAACQLPLLCKEFVVDELQLDAARSFGADAVLVIVRCVAPERLRALIEGARQRELEPFVEITDEAERERALAAGATLIGVNARDLDTLAMDPARTARTLAGLPGEVTGVHLSGLATPHDVARVRASRADAALVGEALMREHDPEPLLRELVRAAGEPL